MFVIGLSVAIINLVNCSSDDDCDLQTCTSNDSDFQAEITVKVTINSENPSVLVTLYEGNFDNGAFLDSRTASKEDVSFGSWTAGVQYSATAMYNKDGQPVLAVDGGELQSTTDNCDCTDGAKDLMLNLELLN